MRKELEKAAGQGDDEMDKDGDQDAATDRLELLRKELIELGQEAAAAALPKPGKGSGKAKDVPTRNLYAEAAAYASAPEKRVNLADGGSKR